MIGVWVLLAALVVAAVVAVAKRLVDGRFRASAAAEPGEPVDPDREVVTSQDLQGATLGSRATFVQFSSSFCSPCRATRVLLADVTAGRDGVEHVEVDAESRLDLVRRLNVLRTPTVLVLDAQGVVRGRASGAPRRDQVESILAALSV